MSRVDERLRGGRAPPDESSCRVTSRVICSVSTARSEPDHAGRMLGSSHSPQKRHFTAAGWICSPQNGQGFTACATYHNRRLGKHCAPSSVGERSRLDVGAPVTASPWPAMGDLCFFAHALLACALGGGTASACVAGRGSVSKFVRRAARGADREEHRTRRAPQCGEPPAHRSAASRGRDAILCLACRAPSYSCITTMTAFGWSPRAP
jgi:hypothetical protein